MKTKEVTREEAKKMLTDIGHMSNVTITLTTSNGEETKTVLNNSFVYNPYGGQVGSYPTGEQNAEAALKFIKREFTVYSNYYRWANGNYTIV